VLAHQTVNETVMRKHTVIPMSFGTVFKTKDDIVELLKSAFDAFSDVLNKMQNKVEFGLKVLWDREAVVRDIEKEDEDIRKLKSRSPDRRARPTSRACSTAASSTRPCRPARSATCRRSSARSATSRWRAAPTSRSATR